jgi:hypothetical protein
MNTADGFVSVIIPVYNREFLVARAIESVLSQTYKKLEVVLVDDGSTDGTGAVLDRYADRYQGKVRVVHQDRSGQVIARNNGIGIATGAYIAFLDSDDTWLPEKLGCQIPLFQKDIGLVYAGIFEVGQNGQVLRVVLPEKKMRGYVYHRLLEKNAITGGSVVVTREALDRVGLFDEKLRAAENWDLWIRISKHFLVDFVNEPLVTYFRHKGNMSSDMELMQNAAIFIYEKHLAGPIVDPRLKKARSRANAYLHYCNGVVAFGKRDYAMARKEFVTCWRHSHFYRDTAVRYFRTFLGKRGNSLISSLRKNI